MLLTKNGIRRKLGVSQKRIWERCHAIPICIYDFEEDENYLNIIGLINGIISGTVKVGYWDGEYHKGRLKTIEEAKEYLKYKKNNFIDLEIKRSKRKDNDKVERIYGSLFTSVLNNSWNTLRYLRCEKTGDENIRRSLLNREFIIQESIEEGVNKRPGYLELFIEFGSSVTEKEAMDIIKEAVIRNREASLNKYTTVYAGSVDGEASGLNGDIICKYYELRQLLKNKFVLPYPILVGRKELFIDRLLENDWPRDLFYINNKEFCLLNILEDVDKVECEYRDSFIQLTDDLNITKEVDKTYIQSFFD